jgi:uncharacterized protein
MHTNRLIDEKSPYLLQHAHNPVDWYPWGEDAFRKAREESKPIFLSVGYSTCHWCHVMEHESFEHEDIAELLNRYFVPIKVDREERPDIDRIYMLFVQATTGSGGWPMSVWLTPELQPFFGGTYFPPESHQNRPGFRYVLERIAEAWRLDRDSIAKSGGDVVEQLGKAAAAPSDAGRLDDSVLESAFFAFRRSFDTRLGGFGGAPKFPPPSIHNFLLRYYYRTGNVDALEMVFATLNMMSRGGIHDHLGGGFHRYSVDERWFVPHFEKMLYDQAQLAISYLEAYQISHDESYAGVARRIFDYVLRDMRDSEGGFYSAEDADSAPDPANPAVKREGAFYLWSAGEISRTLAHPDAGWFAYHYGIEPGGNVFNDPQAEFEGKNILHAAHDSEETAAHFGVKPQDVEASLERSRQKLFDIRSARPRPHLDDKVLTSWNGLMISAFALGARVLGDPSYLSAARRAAGFLLSRMYDAGTGTLLRRFRRGDAGISGFLDDYAFFAQALLDLYETDFNVSDLDAAVRLTEVMISKFEDAGAGAFFSTEAGADGLVLRMKDDYDGAEPSANSIAILNLLRLADFTGRQDFAHSAEHAIAALGGRLSGAAMAVPQMLVAALYRMSPRKQIVVAGSKEAGDTRAMINMVNQRFLPNKIALLIDSSETRRKLAAYHPEVEGMAQLEGGATCYVCENDSCRLPTADLKELADLLALKS